MESLVISPLGLTDDTVEVVERKGLGHPDTICDALAETLSRNLCREYRRCFGTILHHNVDKALLVGGRAKPAFGGGEVVAPIELYLSGRAVSEVGDERIHIGEIAIEGSREWLRANLHALDPERHVRISTLIKPGSQDLQTLFARSRIPLANDTSIGVGYSPMSKLERLVVATEKAIRAGSRKHPAWGEDIKVMGIRTGSSLQLTIACAMIGRHLRHRDDYLAEKHAIVAMAKESAARHGFSACEAAVNSADDASAVYLTVTGTSAEAGDDGQVGRGNRINGVITPGRPMSLEAAAGKNPVTHVGKIYNVLTHELATALTSEIPVIAAAQCLLVSRIGAPVSSPALLHVKLATADGSPPAAAKPRVTEIATEHLSSVPRLIDGFVAGTIAVF